MVPTSSLDKITFIFLIIIGFSLITASFIIKFLKKRINNKIIKKSLRELQGGGLIFGIICLLLTLIRIEKVPFFSMKIWWIVFWISFLAWIIFKIHKIILIKKRIQRAQKKRI